MESNPEFLQPFGDRVMLVFPVKDRLEDGVWVTGRTDGRMDAKVVAVGPRVTLVRPGETVIAERLSGLGVIEYGVEYRIVAEKDILGVVEP